MSLSKKINDIPKEHKDAQEKALSEAGELMNMYKSGFLDGYCKSIGFKFGLTDKNKRLWNRIAPDCVKAFNYRFNTKINSHASKMYKNYKLKGGSK